MSLTPIFIRCSRPEVIGYPDRFHLAKDEIIILEGPAGTNPDGVIWSKGNAPWNKVAHQIACGIYSYLCAKDAKRGKHLIINPVRGYDRSWYGGEVPATNVNDLNGGKAIAVGVLCHKGFCDIHDQRRHRGSRACLTIPDPFWSQFIANFEIGQRGDFILKEDPIA